MSAPSVTSRPLRYCGDPGRKGPAEPAKTHAPCGKPARDGKRRDRSCGILRSTHVLFRSSRGPRIAADAPAMSIHRRLEACFAALALGALGIALSNQLQNRSLEGDARIMNLSGSQRRRSYRLAMLA